MWKHSTSLLPPPGAFIFHGRRKTDHTLTFAADFTKLNRFTRRRLAKRLTIQFMFLLVLFMRRLRITKNDYSLRHACLFVRPHGTNPLPLDGFSWNFMIYLLTAIGLSPGGRSTVHIYTQTVRRTIRNKKYIEQHNNFGRNTTILEEHNNFGRKNNFGRNATIFRKSVEKIRFRLKSDKNNGFFLEWGQRLYRK